MSLKGTRTTTNGLDWNTLHGLLSRLRRDDKHREYLLLATGCYFGLRAGDLLDLKWSAVLNKDEFFVTESKTGKKRKITINDFVKEALQYVSDTLSRKGGFDEEGYLFSNRWGDPISIQYANKQLHSIFEKYSIRVQNGSTHTMRKTFGKRVWDGDGKSERALVYLSEIFSHNTIATTKRYIGITDRQIADVYLKL